MDEITIEKPLFDGKRLTSKVSTTDNLRKYLKNRELFVEYDTDVNVCESILNIPITAAILPLAWLTGSDINVGVLDKTFKISMDRVQKTFTQMYKKIPFKTEIKTEALVDNVIGEINHEKRTGLLFSGGVDSTYSLLKNYELAPRLIMMWGVDNYPYPEHAPHWEKTVKVYSEFAKEKGFEFNLVKTNSSQILDDARISHRYHKEMYDGNVRFSISHSMVMLPIAAPLSIGRFDHLLIAASNSPSFDYTYRPRAARACIDENIIWGDLRVKHDGFIRRNQKIEILSHYLREDNLTLRVCLRSPLLNGFLNDSTCEKCLRTIISLVLYGIDPNSCGFHVDESTFKLMRSMWENTKTSAPNKFWKEIQSMIPCSNYVDMKGSIEFFEWFKGFDFQTTEMNWFYNDLYTSLPYNIAYLLKKVYQKVGISIQQEPNIRI